MDCDRDCGMLPGMDGDPHPFRLNRRDLRAVLLLSLGQLIAWAGLYYLFAALLLTWETETGWTKPELTLALALAVFASGLAAPLVGRVIDAGQGPRLIGLVTAAGGMMVIALPYAPGLTAFYGLWCLIGLSNAGALYEACFALVTRTLGDRARRGITIITLIAGFASMVSFSGAAALTSLLGWQTAVQIFGALVVFVAAPASWTGARMLERAGRSAPPPKTPAPVTRPRTGSAVLLLLASAFPMMALNHGIVLNHLLPLLDERGLAPTTAVLAASLIGPMQVAGRIVMMLVEHRISTLAVTLTSFAGVLIAALCLLASQMAPALVFGAVVLQGAAYGLISIMKPVIIAQLMGPD
ncbi:MAG: MFS transporter, partial [Pseudomonadota bacterium]